MFDKVFMILKKSLKPECVDYCGYFVYFDYFGYFDYFDYCGCCDCCDVGTGLVPANPKVQSCFCSFTRVSKNTISLNIKSVFGTTPISNDLFNNGSESVHSKI